MQFYLISDNIDTQMGLRLAGIEGVVVHEVDEVKKALDDAMQNPEIAIILMTEKLIKLVDEYVSNIKLTTKSPLVLGIPDRHAESDITTAFSRYVKEAIGIKI